MSPADRIDTFLDELAMHLPGPARPRSEILAELHDGLRLAVEDNQRSGIERDDAVEVALRQFGDARSIVASLVPELAAARARQLVLALFTSAPLVTGLWMIAARSRGGARHRLFDSSADHVIAALLIAALVCAAMWTIAATGRATRWLHPALQAPQMGAAATASAVVAADFALLVALSVPLAGSPGTVHRLMLTTAILASLIRVAFASRVFRSCLSTQGDRPASIQPRLRNSNRR